MLGEKHTRLKGQTSQKCVSLFLEEVLVMGRKRLGVGCQGPESAAEIALEIAAMANGPRQPRKTHPNP